MNHNLFSAGINTPPNASTSLSTPLLLVSSLSSSSSASSPPKASFTLSLGLKDECQRGVTETVSYAEWAICCRRCVRIVRLIITLRLVSWRLGDWWDRCIGRMGTWWWWWWWGGGGGGCKQTSLIVGGWWWSWSGSWSWSWWSWWWWWWCGGGGGDGPSPTLVWCSMFRGWGCSWQSSRVRPNSSMVSDFLSFVMPVDFCTPMFR